MIRIKLSLVAKLILLCKILLARYRIIKLVWVANPFPLNDYGRDKFDSVEWQEILGIRYKRIADGTGEYRFFVPALSEDLAWRIDEKYSIRKKNNLPATLEFIATKDGIRDEERYREVWENGKSY